MFGFCFLKLFFIVVFENIENTILVFFENYSCFMSFVFFGFFITK